MGFVMPSAFVDKDVMRIILRLFFPVLCLVWFLLKIIHLFCLMVLWPDFI